MADGAFPYITVAMPVYNEESFVGKTLTELLNQEYPRESFEIIVADGGSVDRTRAVVEKIAKDAPQVVLLPNPGRLPSSGRNVGFRKGKGDIFVVIDGHCHIGHRNLLKNIVECFEKSDADCLGRPQPLDPPGLTTFQQAVALARASWIGHSGKSNIYHDYEGYVSPVSNGAVYKKKIFDKIGFVDETFDACEDVEFNYRVERAGFKTYMSPSLAVKYYPRESLLSLFLQLARYGRGRFAFTLKHPQAFSYETLVPPAFLIGAICLPLLWVLNLIFKLPLLNLLAGVCSLLYFSYFFLVVWESGRIALRQGWNYFLYLPFIFVTIHLGLGWGFLNSWMDRPFRNKDISVEH